MRSKKPNLLSVFTYVAVAVFVIVGGLVFFGDTGIAQVDVGLQQAEEIGLGGGDPRVIVARIIQAALGLLGIVTLGLLVYAGYLWMTSAGNEEQVSRAKVLLRNGLIGLIIILSAFGIVTYVLSILRPDLVQTPPLTQRRGIGGIPGGAGFPIGVIQSHYPDRGQTNVPRNTNVMVTFVEPMLIESIVDNNGTPDDATDDVINDQNIRIFRSQDDPEEGPFVPARAGATEDGRSFVFDPVDLLGNSEENTQYTVVLGEGITTAAGRGAFGNFGAYSWDFEVGTFIDLDPPFVESVVPVQDSTHPRNVVVQVTFNEPMNALTLVGDVTQGFDNVTVRANGGDPVEGRYVISNQYRTIEFITNDLCGTNSCGEDVYCLPGNASLSGNLRAASVSPSPPTALFPYDGITDAASNSLDGNKDGAAQGSPEDDYGWSFNTTNEIDLTAPEITAVSPSPFETLVLPEAPLEATFNKYLLFSSISRESVLIPELDFYTPTAVSEGDHSKLIILHPPFLEETTYTPEITSDLRDLYQNCYRPCVGP